MSDEDILRRNLNLWSPHHPKEAIWLQYVDTDRLKICLTGRELNLKRGRGYFHSPEGPREEAEAEFASIDPKPDVLYVYGVGLGYLYDAAKKWLKKDPKRHLVFLEDDLAVLAKFFETKRASSLLRDKQVFIYYLSDLEKSPVFNKIFWSFPLSDFSCHALAAYGKRKRAKFLILKSTILHAFETKRAALVEYLKFGRSFFKNYYPNLFKLPGAYRGTALFGKFKGVPAIICGAGPSLSKNVGFLRQLKDRALIFAGGSALPALAFAGVRPHFGVGIDPFPDQARRLAKVKDLDFPFFYRGRFNARALEMITGPRLFLPGAGGYKIAEWFEKEFDLEGPPFEEGRNVVTFALEIAALLGCNPILFTGMDLAFSGERQYSEGVIADNRPFFSEKILVKRDIYGRKQTTVWKWLAESEWIADFARSHKNITLINATEGGIGFEGVVNRPLRAVAKKYFLKKINFNRRMSYFLRHNYLDLPVERVRSALKRLKISLEDCARLINGIITEKRRMRRKSDLSEHLQSGKSILAECRLEEEIGYEYVLRVFNFVADYCVERDLIRAKSNNKDILLLSELKLKFLRKAARSNIRFIDKALRESANR